MSTAVNISVVTPVFNGLRFLDRAVQSLLLQTAPEWELLAVDDGSSDGSAERLEWWAARDPRVRVFRHPANRGISAARNTALAAAAGEWVAYLDHDDAFDPDHLARVWAWRDRGDVLVFRYRLLEERPGHPGFGRATEYDPAGRHDRMFEETIAVPLGVAHRRTLLDRVGGFDESLGRYLGQDEDGDLWRRFARAGATFTFVPHVAGTYHVRADSLARTRVPAPPPAAPMPTTAADESTPPRVLFVSYHDQADPTSGAAVCTGDLFRLLTARGWACGVVCGPWRDSPGPRPADPSGSRRSRGSCAGVSFRVASHAAPGYPVTAFLPDADPHGRLPTPAEAAAFGAVASAAIGAFRPDVVLTYGGDPASREARERARAAGARVVFRLHNFAYRSPAAFEGCAAVVVPSALSQSRHRASLGIEAVVLPSAIDPARVVAPVHEPRYLTFVNPDPAKGVFWFTRIAEVLGRTRPDVPMLVVEGRAGVDWLGRCGVDLTGVRTIHRMRNTPDPRAFYRVSKLVLMPSLWDESFGRVAAEAMMNGIPVIASDRGALPEVIGDGGLTLPIPPRFTPESRFAPAADEVAPWVERVVQLWDDGAAYAAAVDRARDRSRCWNSPVILGQWEQFLRDLNCRPNGV